MGFEINIDFSKIKSRSLEEAKKNLDIFADVVVDGVKSRTPEDTKELLKSIGKTSQVTTGTKTVQRVLDKKKLKYTGYVEYGVSGKVYNYHKPKGKIFLTGVGAGMFRRTHFDLKNKFNEYV